MCLFFPSNASIFGGFAGVAVNADPPSPLSAASLDAFFF